MRSLIIRTKKNGSTMQRALIQHVELRLEGLEKIDQKMIQNILNGLSLFEKIILRLTGALFIAPFELKGWKGKIPFYLFKCDKHGYQIGYPNGHNTHLICFECLKANLKENINLEKFL